MRIIKEVKIEYKHKCKCCESIYAYTAQDIDHTWSDYIRCPICGKLDTVSVFDRRIKK